MHSINVSLFAVFYGLAHRATWSDFLIIALAEYLPYFVAALVLIAYVRAWYSDDREKARGYAYAVLSSIVARGAVEIIRVFYLHPRPSAALLGTSLIPETSYSFPSGHAALFFALAMGVYLIDKRFGCALFTFALIIGLARIIAGVHWPSDILGGALLGTLVAWGMRSLLIRTYHARAINKLD